ncbi:MAG: ABC transporter ATP-binding protein [Candidatus Tectimicrobiota bacterium]
MALLTLRDVSKGYQTPKGFHLVLRDIDLDVQEGDFLTIVGYSGSGKTTLMSLIAGLIRPDEGRITLDGAPILEPGPDRGIIFQNYSLLPWLTVLENIALAVDAVFPQLSAAERRQRAEYWAELVNLGPAMGRRPHELSGGMRQRVAVARGLAMDPKMLLLDEPFSALDALTRATLQDELARIWMEQRKTVLMITNDVEEAILLSDRIYPLTPGPGATLGPEIPVLLPRPRLRRHLSLDPAYQEARRGVTEFLLKARQGGSRTGPPAQQPVGR